MTFKERVQEIYPNAEIISHHHPQGRTALIAIRRSTPFADGISHQITPVHFFGHPSLTEENHEMLWENAWNCVQKEILERLSE
jgi:hypothetical protein